MNASNGGWMAGAVFHHDTSKKDEPQFEKWFIFINSSHAKDLIAQRFAGSHHKHPCSRMCCADGKTRDLWELTFHEAVALLKEQEQFAVETTIYLQNGSAQPKEWKQPGSARIHSRR